MCGRFTRKENFQQLAKLLGLSKGFDLSPRYNISPSQQIACVRVPLNSKSLEIVQMKWGLVPSWAKDLRMGNNLINARSETVAEKPSFRTAFRQRRCLILADGFYEWKQERNIKQPYYIHFTDNRLFAFAGIWERWEKGDDEPLESCAILTTKANTLMEPIHYRMPVIVKPQNYALWLDPGVMEPQQADMLFQPHSPGGMEAFPVSLFVNNPRHEGPQCIQRLVESVS